MSLTSKTLLGTTSNSWNYTSEPVSTSGWYGRTSGKQTVSFTMLRFVGRIYLEGTLESNPDDDSMWIPLKLDGEDYLEFEGELEERNINGVLRFVPTGFSGTKYFNIEGNFTYLRVRIYRDYINPDGPPTGQQGYWSPVDLEYGYVTDGFLNWL